MSESTTPIDFRKSVEDAFAPMVEAVKSAQEKIQIPEAARDFVKRSAETAKERAADVHAGAEKATSAIQTAATDAVTGVADFSRKLQAASYDDATAFFSSITKIASAKSLSEAYQMHIDYLRERNDVNIERAKAIAESVSKSLSETAQKAQENLSKLASLGKKAA